MLTTSDLMTIDPDTISSTASLREAVALMNGRGYRQLLVVDEAHKLIGIITDRDVRLAVNSPLLNGEASNRLEVLDKFSVASCMTRNPKTVTPDTPIFKVAQLLSAYKYGALPVVDDGVLVGIVTVTDLLKQMALLPTTEV